MGIDIQRNDRRVAGQVLHAGQVRQHSGLVVNEVHPRNVEHFPERQVTRIKSFQLLVGLVLKD